MKICSKCGILKVESDYFIKDKKTARLHSQCKECYREHRKTYSIKHYEQYGDIYRLRAQNRRKTLRDEFRTNMLQYLKNKSCTLCNEADIRTFEFDHIDPTTKSFSISQAVKLGHRWPAVKTELEKCRILCANCHKKHTALQAGWYKNI